MKKKEKNQMKKVVTLVLTIALIVVTFTGCNSKPTTSSSTSSTNTSSQSQPQPTQTKDPVTLIWYVPGGEETDHDIVMDEFNKKLAEKTNIQLDLRPVPFGDYEQKLNLIVTSQEEFDLCFTSYWLGDFYGYASKGAFLPLDDYLTQVPDMVEEIGQTVIDYAKMNGSTYAIPNKENLFLQFGVTIPKTLADKYGLDIATIPQEKGYETLRALEPFMQAVKDGESGVYPFRARYTPYYNDYEILAGGIGLKKGDDSLKLVNVYETKEWEESVRFLNDWFQRGFIRSDAASVTADDADVYANKYALCPDAMVPGCEASFSKQRNTEIVTVKVEQLYTARDGGLQKATAVSATSKHPQETVQLLELVNTDKELFNLLAYGIEGVHYNKISDEQIELVPDSGYTGQNTWTLGNQLLKYYTTDQEVGLYEEIDALNEKSMESPVKGFALNTDPVKNQLAKVNAVIDEYKLFDSGVYEYDKYYDEYMTKLKAAGIDDILTEFQKQVDEWSVNQ